MDRLMALPGQPAGHIFTRLAESRPATYDAERRTVEVTLSAGARGVRYDWMTGESFDEELSMQPDAVDLSRLNGHAPVLDAHRAYDSDAMIGHIVHGSARLEGGLLVATAQIAPDDELDDRGKRLARRIASGTMRSWSIGYHVQEWERTKARDRADNVKRDLYRAVKWQPYEASIVPAGFDAAAQTRAAATATGADPASVQQEDTMHIRTQFLSPDGDVGGSGGTPAEHASPVLDEAAIRTKATEDERQRATAIRVRGERLGLERSVVDGIIDGGHPLPVALERLIDAAAERNHQTVGKIDPSIRMTQDAQQTTRDGIVDALVHRLCGGRGQVAGHARKFAGATTIDLGRELLRQFRGREFDLGDHHGIADAMLGRSIGMLSTSDFPLVYADAVNKSMIELAKNYRLSYEPFVAERNVDSFKRVYATQIGGGSDWAELPEGAEPANVVITETGENYAIKTYARRLSLTRQMLVNNDLDAPARMLSSVTAGSYRRRNALVYALLTANAAMADGEDLFSSAHSNVSGSAAAPGAATLAAARAAMADQTDSDGNKLDLMPAVIVVPTASAGAYELAATQLLGPIIPNQASNVVPQWVRDIQIVADSRVDSATWYLFASPMMAPVIEVAYVGGRRDPWVSQVPVSDAQGIVYDMYLDFGCGVVDYHGAYRNAAS